MYGNIGVSFHETVPLNLTFLLQVVFYDENQFWVSWGWGGAADGRAPHTLLLLLTQETEIAQKETQENSIRCLRFLLYLLLLFCSKFLVMMERCCHGDGCCH